MTDSTIAAVLFVACVIGLAWCALSVVTAAAWTVFRRRARDERAAMQASGDWDRPDLDPWLREHIRAAAEDAVNERLHRPLRLVWSKPEVTADPPIYLDALAAAEAARADWDDVRRWSK